MRRGEGTQEKESSRVQTIGAHGQFMEQSQFQTKLSEAPKEMKTPKAMGFTSSQSFLFQIFIAKCVVRELWDRTWQFILTWHRGRLQVLLFYGLRDQPRQTPLTHRIRCSLYTAEQGRPHRKPCRHSGSRGALLPSGIHLTQ